VAVVQISRIQIRRGQKNQGEGVPQLASGELAWAIDTQELFIGNGSLVEGAPAVGNTKILTTEDDIFTLANTYAYKKEYPYITTGESPSSPVSRTLQDRLDDFVSIRSFGATGDPNQDATPILQKAIDQLFVNPATKGQEQSRVILYIDPGVYTINNTLYIPPFASIVGAGPERTVIISTANYTMLTVNEESLPEAPAFEDSESPSAATTYGNQPRNILLKGLTLKNTSGIGLYLASCRNSIFEDLDLVGAWTFGSSIPLIDTVNNPTDVAILVKSLSRSVRSHNNLFTRCKLLNWAYGIVGINDVNNNLIESCNFNTLGQGINLGSQWQNDSNGEQEIPSNNKVINSSFISVHSEAIKIVKGSFNISQNNFFKEVGNSGGNEGQATHNNIYYNQVSNESVNDYFTRTDQLQRDFGTVNRPYWPEIGGSSHYKDNFLREIIIPASPDIIDVLKLPGEYDQSFTINYYMTAGNINFHRYGKLTIVSDATGVDRCFVTDEYDHIGEDNFLIGDNYLQFDITFSTTFVNDGTAEEPKWSIYLQSQTGSQVTGSLYFRYKIDTARFQY